MKYNNKKKRERERERERKMNGYKLRYLGRYLFNLIIPFFVFIWK
jgi:hypothetical protein